MKICLIPARSGSKRIKFKNILRLGGKPIISYSIEAAKKSKIFDKIIVYTDSSRIAEIAKKNGAIIPFLRPKKISNDTASDFDVVSHFFKYCKKTKIKLNYLCYLYPTAFLINKKILKNSFKILTKNKNCQKVITICEFKHPIERALQIDKNNNIKFKNKKFTHTRTQKLRSYFHDAAQCYWYNFKKIRKFKKNLNLKTKGLVLNELDFFDIDTPKDLVIAKKLYKLKKL